MRTRMKYPFSLLILTLSVAALAADEKKPAGTLISFSAEASQSVSNDLAFATLYAENTDTKSEEAASKVNVAIASALALAKTVPGVKAKTGSTWTTPFYGKDNHAIEAWRTHSEVVLESRNLGEMGNLLGQMPDGLVVNRISTQPAADTRKKAEDEATLAALNNFQAKAKLIAANFRKYYRIITMNVSGGIQGPAYPAAVAAMMKADAAPMPVEGGDSLITIQVNGEIELID